MLDRALRGILPGAQMAVRPSEKSPCVPRRIMGKGAHIPIDSLRKGVHIPIRPLRKMAQIPVVPVRKAQERK